MAYLVKPGTSAEDLAAQREFAQSLLANAASTKPVGHWTNILAQMAQGGLGGYEQYELGQEGRRQQSEAGDLFEKAIGSLAGTGGATAAGNAAATPVAPMAVSPADSAAAAAGRTIPAAMPQIVRGLVGTESGGDPNARNPLSSATGRGQFINSTWLDMMKGEPEAQGKTPAEILAMRTNPAISDRMTGKYADQNAAALRASGMDVTPGTIKLAHTFGPAGARSIISSGDNVPVAQVMPANVMQANPWIGNKTVGELKTWADKAMAREMRVAGNAAPAAAAPAGAAPAAAAAAPAMNPRLQAASDLYRNPLTRPMAGKFLEAEMARQGKKPEVVSIELGNGQKRSMLQMPDGTLRPIDMSQFGGDNKLPPNFEDSQKLRKEFTAQANVKKFTDSIGPYQSMLKSAPIDTAVADVDMLYGLATILDPESVVREGEYATLTKTQSLPEQLRGEVLRALNGQGRLSQETRAKIMDIAGNRVGSYRERATADVERFSGLAQRFGMDRNLVIQDLPELQRYQPPAAQTQPQPGAQQPQRIRVEVGPDGQLRRAQ
jgi:hypothetical protein